MKKSFKVICAQMERIYKLYLHGYGTQKMLERAERFMFGYGNVGLCFNIGDRIMNTKVVFSTIIGRVPVDADLTLNMSDEFLGGDVESLRGHVTARVSVEKANANTWMDGHKRFNVDFELAVYGDIRALQKQNEEYAAKETNGRHHVDLKTLKVNKIWIDGRYLRIEWYFKDCYGDGRLFTGNMYPVHENFQDKNHENFYCSSEVGLEVYF